MLDYENIEKRFMIDRDDEINRERKEKWEKNVLKRNEKKRRKNDEKIEEKMEK